MNHGLDELLRLQRWPTSALNRAMMEACKTGRSDALRLLLKYGASPDAVLTSSPDDPPSLRKKSTRSPIRQQTSKPQVEDASFKDTNDVKKTREARRASSSARSNSKNQNGRYTVGTNKRKPRDNSSRFDD